MDMRQKVKGIRRYVILIVPRRLVFVFVALRVVPPGVTGFGMVTARCSFWQILQTVR